MNFSEITSDAQIAIAVDNDVSDEGRSTALQSITRMVLVIGGQKFICQAMDLPADHQLFIGGRTTWDHALEELYRDETPALCPSEEKVDRDDA